MLRHAWILALAACTTAPADDTDDTDVVDTDTDTDTVDATCSDEVPAFPKLTGTVKDASGTALGASDVRVQFCRGVTCLFGAFGAGGSFAFEDLEAGPGSFAIAPIGDEGFEPFTPISVACGVDRTIDVVVPDTAPGVAIPGTAAEIEVTDGLYLTVGTGDLPGRPPLEPVPTEIAAVGLAADDEGVPPLEGFTGEAVALFYLLPFDSETAEGVTLPVRLDDPGWSLEGRGRLWYADYFTSTWIDLGALTVDGDSKLVPEDGLPGLSTLLVTRDPL